MIYDGLVNKLTEKTSVNENYDLSIIIDSDTIKALSEASGIILESNRNVKIPKELQLTEEDIIGNVSILKSKVEKQIKYLEDNLQDESNKFLGKDKSKIISDTVYIIYYSILGCTFGEKTIKYNPKMSWYVGILNKYCEEKKRSLIKKDMEKTIIRLKQIQDNGKELNNIQKAWLKDISDNVNKIK